MIGFGAVSGLAASGRGSLAFWGFAVLFFLQLGMQLRRVGVKAEKFGGSTGRLELSV